MEEPALQSTLIGVNAAPSSATVPRSSLFLLPVVGWSGAVAAALCFGGTALVELRLYQFMAERRGRTFLFGAIGLRYVYFLIGGLGAALGSALFLREWLSSRSWSTRT